MATERTSLMPCPTWFGQRLWQRHSGALPPAIVAQRYDLADPRIGHLNYYADIPAVSVRGRETALVLLHDAYVGASSHEVRHLFDLVRGQRPVYALDLPGFGRSECNVAFSADVYVDAIAHMLDSAAQDVGRAVDVVAHGLSAEFAAKVAARHPELVRSLTLLDPTGFASEWERSHFETAARRGKAPLTLRWARRLGLSSLVYGTLSSQLALRCLLHRGSDELRYARDAAQQPGAERAALAFLQGTLFPRENPQAIYTRVHCPTLVVTSASSPERYGQLARFVKWREHFTSVELPRVELGTRLGAAQLADLLCGFLTETEARTSRVASLPNVADV